MCIHMLTQPSTAAWCPPSKMPDLTLLFICIRLAGAVHCIVLLLHGKLA